MSQDGAVPAGVLGGVVRRGGAGVFLPDRQGGTALCPSGVTKIKENVENRRGLYEIIPAVQAFF